LQTPNKNEGLFQTKKKYTINVLPSPNGGNLASVTNILSEKQPKKSQRTAEHTHIHSDTESGVDI